MDSALLSPSQIQKMNSVHFKSLRRVFKFKSSFYHRVLEPSTADCSNEYLAGLAYDTKRVPTPSQLSSSATTTAPGSLISTYGHSGIPGHIAGSHAYRHALTRPPSPTLGRIVPHRGPTTHILCNQMSRLNTPISIMLFSAFHHCNRSEKPITVILSFEWTTLHSTGPYIQSPKIE